MSLRSIGQAAALLGLATSTLRYYDERGLVKPRSRHRGRRYYGPEELRKLAFLQMLQRLHVDLDVAAKLFASPSGRWRKRIEQQIASLDALIQQAAVARAFLAHLLECPTDDPMRECDTMHALLDARIAGTSLESLAEEHGIAWPPSDPAAPGRAPARPRRPGPQ